jgi:hypothetical protein
MALEFDQPKENEQYVKYVYDDKDRLYLRNVYQLSLTKSGPLNVAINKPKKLIYQDIYIYRNSQTPDEIRRIYQPIIEPPTGTRVGNTLTFTSNIISKSPVYASGFIFDGNIETLMKRAQYPDYRNLMSPPSNSPNTRSFTSNNAIGIITHTRNSASTLYIKAYCMVETGTLFSRTLTL